MPLNVLLYYSPRNLGTHPIHSCLLFPQWVIHTALVIYESSESSPYMDRLRHCQSVPWAIIELMFLELDCSQVNQKCSQAGQMGPDGSLNTSGHPATKPPVDTRRLCKRHFEEMVKLKAQMDPGQKFHSVSVSDGPPAKPIEKIERL